MKVTDNSGNVAYTTSTERLLAWADHIEEHPEDYSQEQWVLPGEKILSTPELETGLSLHYWVGTGQPSCGTRFCIAGGLVAYTPEEMMGDCITDWHEAGAYAGGMDQNLAKAIFYSDYEPVCGVPAVLRLIASVPEYQRNVVGMISAGMKDFRGANIVNTDFGGMSLKGIDFRGALTGDTNFDHAELKECNLSRMGTYGLGMACTLFDSCNLSESDFSGAWMNGTIFLNCDLQDMCVSQSTWEEALFRGTSNPNLMIGTQSANGLEACIKESVEARNAGILR